jgi:hypothetical protein
MSDLSDVSFTCPTCHRTSYNPNDALHGWCGACNAVTGKRCVSCRRFRCTCDLDAHMDAQGRLANDPEWSW